MKTNSRISRQQKNKYYSSVETPINIKDHNDLDVHNNLVKGSSVLVREDNADDDDLVIHGNKDEPDPHLSNDKIENNELQQEQKPVIRQQSEKVSLYKGNGRKARKPLRLGVTMYVQKDLTLAPLLEQVEEDLP